MPPLFEQGRTRPVGRTDALLVDRVQGPEFATGVGLALWGSKRRTRPRFRIYDGSAFRKVRARMREWFAGELG